MTTLNIAGQRLLNQQIAHTQCRTSCEVVSRLGAIQAQDYKGALWSIGLRLPAAVEAEIEQAIADRSIIRTWPMRGTLHFVAAADVRWMLSLLTPRVIAGDKRRSQQLGIDDAMYSRSKKIFTRALQGGRQLSRDAMYRSLEDARISTEGQRGYHILRRCAQEGLICFGAREGKQQTFALLDEWTPATPVLSHDEALAALSLRYFTGHGPAALQDFIWWSGLTTSDAKTGIELVKNQLNSQIIAGQTYWMPRDTSIKRQSSPSACLLPGFDEYLLGYKDRSAVLDPAHVSIMHPGNNGMFKPTTVIDGQLTGIWKCTVKANTAVISATPFTSFNKAGERALELAAKRYTAFVSKSASTVFFG